jgi:hydroxymethylpyrimidine pyrophosphatase-like HAD family hydrolase
MPDAAPRARAPFVRGGSIAMPHRILALAVDYDGTLTERPRPDDATLDALRALRDAGRRVVLVTGRILAELRADFPDVDAHFDAIVGENGAVLARGSAPERALASAVPDGLERALHERGVPLRRGRVLLACDALHGGIVNTEIARLGLELQLVRNRGALMVLPAGVTKGSGVLDALAELGLSAHGTVGIGDAENDHSLLDACELGVAVANAIPSLRERADIVLREADGSGIAAFLAGPLRDGLPGVEPRRWRIALGADERGAAVTIPASGVSVEIYGDSGTGKSYLAGLIVEQLAAMRYTVCVLDLEGDHVPLAALLGVMTVGGQGPLPDPELIAALPADGVSLIVDLSLQPEERKRDYAVRLLEALHRARMAVGMPHWVVVEEAHIPMRAGVDGWWCREAPQPGLCVVSYRPELVCRNVRRQADVVLTLASATRASLVRRSTGERHEITIAPRSLPHVRHWRKYTEGRLPPHRRFHFRDRLGPTGGTAGNMPEFLGAVRHAPEEVLRHHAAGGDFSRWLGDLARAPGVVGGVAAAERALTASGAPAAVAEFRRRVMRVVAGHYTRGALQARNRHAR